jgi:poly(A) polymerase
VLPEIARMKGVEQPPQYHPEGDVWVHTLMLLASLKPGCSHDPGLGSAAARCGQAADLSPRSRIASALTAMSRSAWPWRRRFCRRFRFSNEETRQILALVENHMRFADAAADEGFHAEAIFSASPVFERASGAAPHGLPRGSGNLDHWEFVRERWLLDAGGNGATPSADHRPRTDCSRLQAGSRLSKQMLRAVEDAQLEGTIATEEEALRMVKERWKAEPDEA